jgi:hypothetical protein
LVPTSTLPYITDMIQQFNDLPPFTSRFHLDLTPTTGHCYTNEMACVFDGPKLSPQPQSRWLIGTFRGGPNSNPTPGMPFKIQVTLLLYHRSVTTWLTSSVSHPRTLIQALSSPNRSSMLNPATFEAAKTRFLEVMHLSLEQNIVRPPFLSHAVTACSSTFTDSNIQPHTIDWHCNRSGGQILKFLVFLDDVKVISM